MTEPNERCDNPNCQRIDMTMMQASEWSRKQYEGGERFERERIIALLEIEHEAVHEVENWLMDIEFKIDDGSDVVHSGMAYQALKDYKAKLIALIKGEQK